MPWIVVLLLNVGLALALIRMFLNEVPLGLLVVMTCDPVALAAGTNAAKALVSIAGKGTSGTFLCTCWVKAASLLLSPATVALLPMLGLALGFTNETSPEIAALPVMVNGTLVLVVAESTLPIPEFPLIPSIRTLPAMLM